jgi:hypothetical protein
LFCFSAVLGFELRPLLYHLGHALSPPTSQFTVISPSLLPGTEAAFAQVLMTRDTQIVTLLDLLTVHLLLLTPFFFLKVSSFSFHNFTYS